MVIGEHTRENDLEVNPLKGKQLTNVRASGTDDAVRLTTPVTLTLEQAIAYIDDDELVEVTPNAIRLRKRYLDPHERKRQAPLRTVSGTTPQIEKAAPISGPPFLYRIFFKWRFAVYGHTGSWARSNSAQSNTTPVPAVSAATARWFSTTKGRVV